MTPRYRAPARIFGLLLFVLAVSPVTAPFSTCDLVAVLCGGAGQAGASIHSKASPDEPVSSAGSPTLLQPLQHSHARRAVADVREVSRSCTHDVPLRI